MHKWLAVAALALIVGCGGSQKPRETPRDPEPEVEGPTVYDPSKYGGQTETNPDTPPKETNPDPTVEKPKEQPKEQPKNPPKEQPKNPPKEQPKDPVVTKPKETPKETPKESPKDPVVEKPKEQPKEPPKEQPKQPPQPTAHEKNADEFVRVVLERCNELEETKAYKDYVKAMEAFQKSYDHALQKKKDDNGKGQDLEQAWADTLKDWYAARYAQQLFLHLYFTDSSFEPVFVHDREEVLTLSDAQLLSSKARESQAAHEVVAQHSARLNAFRTDSLKYDLTCQKVHEDKKWQKRFEDAKKKFEDAASGKFDEKDLKKYR